MGTRGTITIKDGKKTILTIYRQYDSYLDGLGSDLIELLKGREIVNGFSGSMTLKTHFNGMGDLAAYVLMELKKDAATTYDMVIDKKTNKYKNKIKTKFGLGNIYVIAALKKGEFEEYNYTIYLKKNAIFLKCTDYNGEILIDKNVNEITAKDLKD